VRQESFDENEIGIKDFLGLNFVDFEIGVHANDQNIVDVYRKYAQVIDRKIYILDDKSAISCTDGKIKVISEGQVIEA